MWVLFSRVLRGSARIPLFYSHCFVQYMLDMKNNSEYRVGGLSNSAAWMKFCQFTFLQTADIHTFVLVIHFCNNFYITFILHVYDMTYEKIGGDGGTDGYRVTRLPSQVQNVCETAGYFQWGTVAFQCLWASHHWISCTETLGTFPAVCENWYSILEESLAHLQDKPGSLNQNMIFS